MLPPIKMEQVENLKTVDPFADAGDVDLKSTNKIHIRSQQVSGPTKRDKEGNVKPRLVTTISGLPDRFDKKKILQFIKKKLACAGTIINDETWGEVIQLQGDLREEVQDFVSDRNGLELSRDLIVLH
ncbi:hypothetical protein MFRU_015g00470 [Monilinia fructicola]|uniref:SUI1 domain-containing protein n=1 Tax=Monilinia fructicola TaxID=38448 RepID=A0A5M9JYC2_MONFR|nr:hypothetical protein EYC84_005990 [Monilinia fructicola]KAG4029504.1 hypothetical protein MFRU_015g00470 [Monilinia fructicola]